MTTALIQPVQFDTNSNPLKRLRSNNNSSNRRMHSSANAGRWTKEEHQAFLQGLEAYGKEWKKIADLIKTRTVVQIRTHAQKYFQKVAKSTGGPVMSTSKKDDVVRPPRKRQALMAHLTGIPNPPNPQPNAEPTNTYPSHIKQSSETMPNPRVTSSPPKSAPTFHKPKTVPHNRKKHAKIDASITFIPTSGSSLNLGSPEEKYDAGGATPRTVAAATILLRPRLQHRIQSGGDTPTTRETAEWLARHQEDAEAVLSKPNTPDSKTLKSENIPTATNLTWAAVAGGH